MDNYSRAGILADIYGSLLTKKQLDTLCLYLYEDCSLYEISEKWALHVRQRMILLNVL